MKILKKELTNINIYKNRLIEEEIFYNHSKELSFLLKRILAEGITPELKTKSEEALEKLEDHVHLII